MKRGHYKIHVVNKGWFKKGLVPKNKGLGRKYEGDKECPVCYKIFHYKCKQYIRSNGYIAWSETPKTCSVECRYQSAKIKQQGKSRPHMQGENAYQWRGGISNIYKRINRSSKYADYRLSCFKRDNFTCQICGIKGSKDLQADHFPITFAQIIDTYQIKSLEEATECELLWDLRNIRTLCIPCHKKTDTWGIPLKYQKKV